MRKHLAVTDDTPLFQQLLHDIFSQTYLWETIQPLFLLLIGDTQIREIVLEIKKLMDADIKISNREFQHMTFISECWEPAVNKLQTALTRSILNIIGSHPDKKALTPCTPFILHASENNMEFIEVLIGEPSIPLVNEKKEIQYFYPCPSESDPSRSELFTLCDRLNNAPEFFDTFRHLLPFRDRLYRVPFNGYDQPTLYGNADFFAWIKMIPKDPSIHQALKDDPLTELSYKANGNEEPRRLRGKTHRREKEGEWISFTQKLFLPHFKEALGPLEDKPGKDPLRINQFPIPKKESVDSEIEALHQDSKGEIFEGLYVTTQPPYEKEMGKGLFLAVPHTDVTGKYYPGIWITPDPNYDVICFFNDALHAGMSWEKNIVEKYHERKSQNGDGYRIAFNFRYDLSYLGDKMHQEIFRKLEKGQKDISCY